jgi:hypothetical protein
MSLLAQLVHTLWHAPLSPLRMGRRARLFLALYMLLAGALLALLAWLLLRHASDIKAALVGYLLPESWSLAGYLLLDNFLAQQTKAVVVNAVVSGTLVLVSVLLFPVKEQASLAFEREARLTDQPIHEFPLWFQGWEEIKLVLLYLAAQMSVFWIGYHPHPGHKAAATALSFVYLWSTVALDFISPLLQRHRLRYSQILKTLLGHPLAMLGFGALFSLPAVLAGMYVKTHPGLAARPAVALLFGGNLLSIVWACAGGTWLGARLLEPAAATPRSAGVSRLLAWTALLLLLGGNGYVFGSLALSVQRKSQLLKCHYSVDPATLRLTRPSISGLLRGRAELGLHFELTVYNPTRFDVELEDNRLEIRHGQTLVARSRLTPMRVPAGQTQRQHLALRLILDPTALLKGRALLTDKWTVTLYARIARGIELPIYIRHGFARTLREQLGREE